MRRRLLERLQQGVEGMSREHVDLVDEVHLVAAAAGGVLHIVEQLARVVDLRSRGRVDFDQVYETTPIDLGTRRARTAGLGCNTLLAVQTLRENARDGGLAHTSRPREQECEKNAARFECVHQGAADMLLSNQLR